MPGHTRGEVLLPAAEQLSEAAHACTCACERMHASVARQLAHAFVRMRRPMSQAADARMRGYMRAGVRGGAERSRHGADPAWHQRQVRDLPRRARAGPRAGRGRRAERALHPGPLPCVPLPPLLFTPSFLPSFVPFCFPLPLSCFASSESHLDLVPVQHLQKGPNMQRLRGAAKLRLCGDFRHAACPALPRGRQSLPACLPACLCLVLCHAFFA